MKQTLLLILLVTGSFYNRIAAQDIYKTIHGDIAISITDHDSVILMISNELSIQLDYITSKVTLTVPLATFTTRIDSIDEKLSRMGGYNIEFTGKLGIAIDTKNFTPQRYNMEGLLTSISPPVPIRGNGSMTCLPAGDKATPACTLLISFETSLANLYLKEVFASADNGVRIDVRQSILERENE